MQKLVENLFQNGFGGFFANPIYDAVFKYLLDDNKVDIILISNVLGKNIESLEMASQELPLELVPKNTQRFRICNSEPLT